MARNKKFPYTKCPYCGGGMFTVRQRISGTGEYYVYLDNGDIESSSLHDYLQYSNKNKYAICTDCGKRLFKIDNELNVIN